MSARGGRVEGGWQWLANHRRRLLHQRQRQTWVLGRLDASPPTGRRSTVEDRKDAVGNLERQEFKLAQLNVGNVIFDNRRTVDLDTYARRWNSQLNERDQHRHQRTSEAKQQTDSRTIEVASASAGTGAAPGAGEAAAHGAGEAASAGTGEAASAGSRRRSRSRSRSIASSVQADGQRPRRWRQQRPISRPRQQAESSARWSSPCPESAAEARLPPRMAPAKVLAPTPTVKPRKPAPSVFAPMRMPLPIPSTTPPPKLKEVAWVRVKRG